MHQSRGIALRIIIAFTSRRDGWLPAISTEARSRSKKPILKFSGNVGWAKALPSRELENGPVCLVQIFSWNYSGAAMNPKALESVVNWNRCGVEVVRA